MLWYIRKTVHLDRKYMDFGWGNGYVCIPPDHLLYGVDYNEIHNQYPELDVHGGLTFSCYSDQILNHKSYETLPEEIKEKFKETNYWIVGFDTCHLDDTLAKWSKDRVAKETKKLAIQLDNYKVELKLKP